MLSYFLRNIWIIRIQEGTLLSTVKACIGMLYKQEYPRTSNVFAAVWPKE